MRCLTDTDLDLFAARALPHLVADPVRHNLAYGLVAARRDGTVPVEPGAVWLRVVDGERLVTVALRTPPFPLLLTGAPPVAVDRLVDHLLGTGVELPEVSGPADLAARFADRWSAATSGEASVTGRARLFRLDTVTPPRGVPGRPRTATPADRERLVDWLTAFHAEAGPGGPSPGAATVSRSRATASRAPTAPAAPVATRPLTRPPAGKSWHRSGTRPLRATAPNPGGCDPSLPNPAR
jgi:hypothetical protein